MNEEAIFENPLTEGEEELLYALASGCTPSNCLICTMSSYCLNRVLIAAI